MAFFEFTLARGKLVLIFLMILALLRFKVPLWLAILIGCLVVALLTGIPMGEWFGILVNALANREFVLLMLLVFLILMLSGVQEATGQSRKMVRGISQYLARKLRARAHPGMQNAARHVLFYSWTSDRIRSTIFYSGFLVRFEFKRLKLTKNETIRLYTQNS